MATYHWSARNPKGPASEPVQLVREDGTLTGGQISTLVNGWGVYQDKQRDDMEALILKLVNSQQK